MAAKERFAGKDAVVVNNILIPKKYCGYSWTSKKDK